MKFYNSLMLIVLACMSFTEAAIALQNQRYGAIVDPPKRYEPATMTYIKDVGMGFTRIWVWWKYSEPTKGNYNFQVVDKYIQSALANGLDLYLSISPTPPGWANGTSADCQVFSERCAFPPYDPNDFVNFVKVVVNRYKSQVSKYGIWNEPDLGTFWDGSFKQYIDEILVPGARAVKEIMPNAKVIGPEIFRSKARLGQALRKSCRYLDVVGVHLFSDTPQKNIKVLERDYLPTIAATCPGKPIWITAFGAQTEDHGEQGQADFLVQMFTLLDRQPLIEKLIMYKMMGFDVNASGGCLVVSGSQGNYEKPAYTALKNYIRSRSSQPEN